MQDVAIIGAGELGGALAHALARSNLVRAITLIDDTRRVAAGKALDITQAAPVEGFATQLSGATDVSMAAGASIVIVADRVTGGEWQGEDGLVLLKRLHADRGRRGDSLRRAVAARAGRSRRARAAHRADAAVRLGARGAGRRARARWSRSPSTARRATSSLSVLGVPPAHTVIPWDDATIAGLALTRRLDEPVRRRLSARIAALWPPGPYALAAAATSVVEAMAGRFAPASPSASSRRMTPPARARAQRALPVRLGPAGIVEVVLPSLSAVEQVALDNAMLL